MMYAASFSTPDLVMTIAIVVILLVLIFLAVAETALNRISKVKAHSLVAESGSKSSLALKRLVTHPERFINPLLVTVTFLQTGQAFLMSLVANRLFGAAGVFIAFVLNVVVFFVLSEAMPKTWAVLTAERAALATARPVELLVGFPPLQYVSRGLISLTNVLLPGKGLKQGPFVSELELLGFVDEAVEHEVIDPEERELIESIIEFGDTVAREVMVPRPDIVTVDETATVSAALDEAIAHGYSRLPIVERDGDDFLGLAYTKDLMRMERDGRGDAPASDLARPVRFVPENKPVSSLMREMQAEKFHLAIVADEYGAITGLITLEDCLEELVGEIVDEYDVEEAPLQRLSESEYVIDGGMQISDINDELGLDLPDDDWDTLGGFVFGTLGHVPSNGDVVVHAGWQFIAAEIDGRRIRRVRVVAPADDSADRSDPPEIP